jgi:hypothetical protein
MTMSNERHEDKSQRCRMVGCRETTQAPRSARTARATWLCTTHRAALRFTIRERTQLRELEGLMLQGQLALADDGWLTPVAPTPRKPQPIAYDDDGFARYRDPSSPHGQTVRPERDTLLGDDPRLTAYREAEELSPEGAGYTVTVDDPPPGVEPEAGE